MSDSRDPYPYLEDRPTLWPHNTTVERHLPDGVEQRLVQAAECLRTNPPRAAVLAEDAVAQARADSRDDSVLSRTLYRAAAIMQQGGRPDRAYVLCLEAQPLFERSDDRWRATRILLLRGQCCLDVGEHPRAQTLTEEAADRFRLMEDRTEMARSLTLGALARRLAGDLDGAVERAQQAVTLIDATRNPQLDISLRNNEAFLRVQRGHNHQRLGDRQAAQAEFARAAALLPDARSIVSVRNQPDGGQVLETIVQVTMATGDRDGLAAAMKRLATWTRLSRGGPERGLAWLRMAECQRLRGRQGAAIAAARRAVSHLSRQSGVHHAEALMQLTRLLEDAGDVPNAYNACLEGMRLEAENHRRQVALRADLLALDLQAEQELRKTERTLAYAQRLSNVGHLVASVNHELNQPMASIRMQAETAVELIEQGEREEVTASLRSMLKLGTRLTDLTSQFAAFPAQSTSELQPVSVYQAVSEAIAMLSSRLRQTPCEIEMAVDAQVMADSRESQLVRVVANLVNNALDAQEPVSGKRKIAFRCAPGDPGRIVLSVTDNGPGLAPTVLSRLFQPFFSTKAVGRGLGLGLAMSRDVMREMGGDLTAHNSAEGGAVFEVTLPLAAPYSGR